MKKKEVPSQRDRAGDQSNMTESVLIHLRRGGSSLGINRDKSLESNRFIENVIAFLMLL
jgi:hypothetical protein